MTSLASQAFAEYLSRIELNQARVAQASISYNFVKDWIESAIPGAAVRRIGSFQRQTKIKPLAEGHGIDVDALVCLGSVNGYASPGAGGITTEAALESVRRALAGHRRFRLMRPVKDAPAVTLAYADEAFSVELVPAFIDATRSRTRPFGPACYLVPAPEGCWIPADYDYDAEYISSLNRRPDVGGDLVRMIKLSKAWFRSSGIGLKSFFIEVLSTRLVPEIVAEWSRQGLVWELPHLFAAFLAHSPGFVRGPLNVPGSLSGDVHSGLAAIEALQVQGFVQNQSRRAYALAFEVNEAAACDAWREFFGDPFPALSAVA